MNIPTTPKKCGFGTSKTNFCEKDSVGMIKLPIAAGTVQNKEGRFNDEGEIWSEVHVCEDHVVEALQDFTPKGPDLSMSLRVNEDHITLSFGNGAAYQVPNDSLEDDPELIAIDFMADLAKLGYLVHSAEKVYVN